MDRKDSSINHFFSAKVIRDLLTTGSSEIYDRTIAQYIDNPESKTNGQLVREIYNCAGYC